MKTTTSRCFSDCSFAEIAVDNWLPTPWYYIRPMDFAWAMDIIRRAAVECKEREIRRPKLYESLDLLEKQLDEKSTWLVRHYRRELRWESAQQSREGRAAGDLARDNARYSIGLRDANSPPS